MRVAVTEAETLDDPRGRAVAAFERAEFDVDDVVGEPTAVGEAGKVAVEHAETARGGRRGDRHVQPQQIRLLRPREVEARDARQEYRHQVSAAARRRVVERVVERVRDSYDLRVRVAVQELGVVLGFGRIPAILLSERDDDLVDQGLSEAGNLPPARDPLLRPVGPQDPYMPAAGARVHADDRVRALRPG